MFSVRQWKKIAPDSRLVLNSASVCKHRSHGAMIGICSNDVLVKDFIDTGVMITITYEHNICGRILPVV